MTMQGGELKALRKAAGLSQAELADAIGMTRETVGAMERDQAPIEKRTELAVRYVIERAPPPGSAVAGGVIGQGQAATMNLADIRDWLIPFLDARYARK